MHDAPGIKDVPNVDGPWKDRQEHRDIYRQAAALRPPKSQRSDGSFVKEDASSYREDLQHIVAYLATLPEKERNALCPQAECLNIPSMSSKERIVVLKALHSAYERVFSDNIVYVYDPGNPKDRIDKIIMQTESELKDNRIVSHTYSHRVIELLKAIR